MKLSEVLKKDFPKNKHAGNPDDIDLLNEAWKEGYNTALESCDREIDVKELAYIILEFYENECADDAMDIHRLSDRIISTMPTWLRKVSEK